jgi:uncharacterized protein YdhG (YjbR/CyaY superfamily)
VSPAAKNPASAINAYIAAAPEAMRGRLRRMRDVIAAAAPDAVEVFAYGIPGFKYLGRPLVYYGAAKKHYALYGVSVALMEAIKEDWSAYEMSKGTIRFPPGEAVPERLVTKLVQARVLEAQAADAGRKAKARARRTAPASKQ